MIKEFLKLHGDYRDDRYFKEITTIKMGGAIAHYVAPYNIDDLKEIVSFARQNLIPFKIIGNGSNIIAGSNNYDGIVISLKRLDNFEINNDEVYVEAGVLAPYFSNVMANAGLSGFEFASGIPGSIGGLIYMNAGAYKKEMSDIIEEVTILRNDEVVTLKKDELAFSYRHSILQDHPHWIALACKLKMSKKEPNEIKELMEERYKRRVSTQPLNMPSAGSCFRNPDTKFAWEIIDELGYRGYQLNGIKVSDKHSNFIVNNGGGTAEDFLKIVYDIQDKVKDKYNIKLIMEVEKFNC